MLYLILKYAMTAAIIVAVSEIAKRSDRIGALVASLPLVTVLTLLWLHFEKQNAQKIGNHAYYTFWYVLPTLPMFLVFPALQTRFGFWWALISGILLTIVLFALAGLILKRFGIELY